MMIQYIPDADPIIVLNIALPPARAPTSIAAVVSEYPTLVEK